MIEANEDISLVTERQIRDVEQAQAQAKAIAEGREEHPAQANLAVESVPSDMPQQAEQTSILVQPPAPPPDPDAAMRHLRLSIVVIIVLVLFLVWFRQKKG